MVLEYTGEERRKLPKVQKEVLRLIEDEFFTPSEVARSRETSTQAVYEIIDKLKAKGYLGGPLMRGIRGGGVGSQGGSFCKGTRGQSPPLQKGKKRLHGWRWHCVLAMQSHLYRDLRRKKAKRMINGNRVLLHRHSIEVYSHVSIHGNDTLQSERQAEEYWQAYFKTLSVSLGATWKRVRCVRMPQVETKDSEVAYNVREEDGKKYHLVRGTHDGKVWLTLEASHGIVQHETQHPKTSIPDDLAEVVAQSGR